VPFAVMRKKPWPLMATSRGLEVTLMLPWPNCGSTAVRAVPMPTELPPPPESELANTSAKLACAPLKPAVFELATLLPITSRFFAAALRPERPC
jgi:hypothetical protein